MNAQGDNVSWLNLYWKGNKIDEGSKWISRIENELLNIISFQIKTKTYDSFPFCNLRNLFYGKDFLKFKIFILVITQFHTTIHSLTIPS